MKRPALVITLLMIVASGVPALHAQAPESIPAKLDLLIQKVNSLLPQTKTTTALLFPFATNAGGFDTAITVSNYGDTNGVCALSFFGSNVGTPVNPVVAIAAKAQYVTLISTTAPGFQGFIRVDCNFPTARGWGFLSDIGARNIAAGIPVEVLP